jgi:YggT family protein
MNIIIAKFAMLCYLLTQLYIMMIIVACISSWFIQSPPRDHPINYLRRLTDPYLNVFRNLLPFLNFGGIDVSPLAGFYLLYFIAHMFAKVAQM